jgi:hypothetical protein
VPKKSNRKDAACRVSSATGDEASHVSTNPFAANVSSTKEFDFLRACAGVELSAECIVRIEHWSESGIDWNELLRLAEHHGVLPMMARNLASHARGLPSQVEHSLRSAFDVNLRRNLWFASELARIVDQFEKKQLRAIPYKGPLLAESAYGDVALRNFGDLDFLISPTDFEQARQALAELGYRPSSELSPAAERYWLRNGYERSFDSAAGKYLVELQWALLPRFYAVDLLTDDLLARSKQSSLGGRKVPSLSPEDLLIVLCLHAAKHLWMRLIWVCDIAETMRTHRVDWVLVCTRARELGVLRIMGVSFWLAQQLLDCRLPEPAQAVMSRDQEIPVLGEQFAGRLCRSATYDFESTEYFRLLLKLRERPGDRGRYLWRLIWTPGDGDLKAIKLPEAMFPLYRVIRAVRLMRKIF